MSAHIDGWWFSKGRTLPHGDGRRIKVGITHGVKGAIVACENGLHASVKPLDALGYAPGPVVWRVRLSGVIVPHGEDKHAASERTYLAGGVDAAETLRKFARLEALRVVHLWAAPDVVRRYLRTGDEALRDAARDAAGGTARAAARAAAWAAAWAAAGAAWDAARAAAWAAAWAAAGAAAGAAYRETQNRRLTRMLNAAIKEAA